ncbi:MAG: SRPBCC domain-containing protein [Bacteroidetes bacterium]|nr:SRPBCC domain-containing protein [Bacteroidota bacterium]
MSSLLFNFTADKEKNTLTITREFAANRQLVWDCYTKAELLSQWFAPRPFTVKSKSMNFSEGGHWHYAMVSPEGDEYWGYSRYLKINPIDYYESTDAFCNEAGEVNEALPQARWEVTFTDKGEITEVHTVIYYATLHDLESIINMGMKDGLTAALIQLDELILTLTSSK